MSAPIGARLVGRKTCIRDSGTADSAIHENGVQPA